MFVAKKITKFYKYSDEKINALSTQSFPPSQNKKTHEFSIHSPTLNDQSKTNKTIAKKPKTNKMFSFSNQTKDLLKNKGINIYLDKDYIECPLSENCINALPKGNYYVISLSTPRFEENCNTQAFNDFNKQTKDNTAYILCWRYAKNPSVFDSAPTEYEHQGIKYKMGTILFSDNNYNSEIDNFNLKSIANLSH